jgi:ribosomal protein S4
MSIPSATVSVGQAITLAKSVSSRANWAARADALSKYEAPRWLQASDSGSAAAAGKVTALPEALDSEAVINAQAIIEFYSK